jgi:hypothetical protein
MVTFSSLLAGREVHGRRADGSGLTTLGMGAMANLLGDVPVTGSNATLSVRAGVDPVGELELLHRQLLALSALISAE